MYIMFHLYNILDVVGKQNMLCSVLLKKVNKFLRIDLDFLYSHDYVSLANLGHRTYYTCLLYTSPSPRD